MLNKGFITKAFPCKSEAVNPAYSADRQTFLWGLLGGNNNTGTATDNLGLANGDYALAVNPLSLAPGTYRLDGIVTPRIAIAAGWNTEAYLEIWERVGNAGTPLLSINIFANWPATTGSATIDLTAGGYAALNREFTVVSGRTYYWGFQVLRATAGAQVYTSDANVVDINTLQFNVTGTKITTIANMAAPTVTKTNQVMDAKLTFSTLGRTVGSNGAPDRGRVFDGASLHRPGLLDQVG